MIGDELYRDLKEIESRDPDGGEVQPTDAAYAAHKAWAIRVYGVDTWRIYNNHTWGVSEV